MPLQQLDLFQWRLMIDAERTSEAYQHLAVGCNCSYCRNFLAVQAQLPTQVFHILQLLGVDPAKPAEIVEYTQNPDGSHLYSWWYHIIGQMRADRQRGNDAEEQLELTSDIRVSIAAKVDVAPADFPRPVLQIEFFGNLPWVLDNEPDNQE